MRGLVGGAIDTTILCAGSAVRHSNKREMRAMFRPRIDWKNRNKCGNIKLCLTFDVRLGWLSRNPCRAVALGWGGWRTDMTAIRPLLIGIILILALVLIALSILLVDPAQPLRQSDSLIPMQTEPTQQRP